MHWKWLIVTNGHQASLDAFDTFRQNRHCCVCDGAFNAMSKKIDDIDVVIGDMDSIDEASLRQIKNDHNIELVHIEDQNTTDCEKAIQYCLERSAGSILILGGFGGRIDHSLVNLKLMKHYQSDTCSIAMINGPYHTQIASGTINVEGKPGDHVSLIGFPKAVVTTKGLQYDSQEYLITIDGHDSACNALQMKTATIEIKGCAVLTVNADTQTTFRTSSSTNS